MRIKNSGVTFVELVVVLTIITLLAVIGFPSYQTYLMETRRSDAINTLRENELILDNYYQQYGSMPTSSAVSLYTTSPGGFYNIAYTQVSSTRFKLVATAASGTSQVNDTGCTTITLVSEMENVYPPECH